MRRYMPEPKESAMLIAITRTYWVLACSWMVYDLLPITNNVLEAAIMLFGCGMFGPFYPVYKLGVFLYGIPI